MSERKTCVARAFWEQHEQSETALELSLSYKYKCDLESIEQGYRYYVIYKLRQLKFLDSRAVTSAERAEARRVGAFMRVARPPLHVGGSVPWADGGSDSEADAYRYTPVPPIPTHGIGRQRMTVYGMLKYKYTGKHSEGNRFIRKEEL
ncbi:leucine-rich melanocyte differentiation-associated protein [Dermacentor silvarum]|uniref:leucine-rich melanocyte differentiation-associated protein n=1 Tax=Dermacentor silvarum TaxID=543639 RepID=UPI001898550D|nr:leucine-rich melanocyte differentiation-associated protein [Dermacentor silvarum]